MNAEIVYKNRGKTVFSETDGTIPDCIKKGFETDEILYMDIPYGNDESRMRIEFGKKCCDIGIWRDKKVYGFKNSDTQYLEAGGLEDLYTGDSQPKYLMCYNVHDALEIFKNFMETGKPSGNYLWIVEFPGFGL
ncbi:MAG: hypothetical protein LBK40_01425 [Spirochaetaceae bacterium]|jgi:hypothetical protein|nr:hypothetical protein [Spirochaetaceae bacterium]